MTRILGFGLVVLLFVAPRVLAHEGHDDGPTEQTFKIATNGEVKFGEDVRFGDFLVKKGKYVLEHRVDGERHVIVLSAVTKAETKTPVVYDVPTQTVVSKLPVKRSAVFAAEGTDHLLRATVVQIAGENIDHLPFSNAVPATR